MSLKNKIIMFEKGFDDLKKLIIAVFIIAIIFTALTVYLIMKFL